MNKEQTLYKEYYSTPHWKEFKKKLLDPDDTVCELCGCRRWFIYKRGNKPRRINRIFTVHHKHYRSLGHEKREDVMVVCKFHHDLCHDILRMANNSQFVADLKEVVHKHFEYEEGAYQEARRSKEDANNF